MPWTRYICIYALVGTANGASWAAEVWPSFPLLQQLQGRLLRTGSRMGFLDLRRPKRHGGGEKRAEHVGRETAERGWGDQGAPAIPEHEVHQLQPLPLQEAIAVGAEHQAGAQGVKQVFHHLLFLCGAGVVSFENLQADRDRKGSPDFIACVLCISVHINTREHSALASSMHATARHGPATPTGAAIPLMQSEDLCCLKHLVTRSECRLRPTPAGHQQARAVLGQD